MSKALHRIVLFTIGFLAIPISFGMFAGIVYLVETYLTLPIVAALLLLGCCTAGGVSFVRAWEKQDQEDGTRGGRP